MKAEQVQRADFVLGGVQMSTEGKARVSYRILAFYSAPQGSTTTKNDLEVF